jgi:hypothetical protein
MKQYRSVLSSSLVVLVCLFLCASCIVFPIPALAVSTIYVPDNHSTINVDTDDTPFLVTLQYLTINPRQAYINEPVTITANVVNLSAYPNNYKVVLIINNEIEQEQMVSVGPRASQLVKFTVTRSIPGSYTVNLGSQRGSFTVIDTETNARAPLDDATIILIVMGILIIAAAIVLVLSFRPAKN